jgi:hypothetical protein
MYCLGMLPGVVTDQIVETAKNRAQILRETREGGIPDSFRAN